MTGRHKSHGENIAQVWVDQHDAAEDLDKVIRAYRDYLETRAAPAAPETVVKYIKVLESLSRSLVRQGLPLILGSVTAESITIWVKEQRDANQSPDGIASRLGAVKVFTNKYLFKHLELTRSDLLSKVPRITPPERPAQVLTLEEIEAVLNAYDKPTFEDIRNRALVACYIATGLRLREVLELSYSSLDRVTGTLSGIRAKGGGERSAVLAPTALKHVKAYLRYRPDVGKHERLWLKADGGPLSYWATHTIMTRLKARSGVGRLHWHLFRHGFAQHALMSGADPSIVQEMLGHRSNAMTRKYLGHVRQIVAAQQMPKYSPI